MYVGVRQNEGVANICYIFVRNRAKQLKTRFFEISFLESVAQEEGVAFAPLRRRERFDIKYLWLSLSLFSLRRGEIATPSLGAIDFEQVK